MVTPSRSTNSFRLRRCDRLVRCARLFCAVQAQWAQIVGREFRRLVPHIQPRHNTDCVCSLWQTRLVAR